MFKNSLGFLLIQLFSFGLIAQEVTVKDIISGDSLEAVTFNSNQPKISAVTNQMGVVNLSNFKGVKKIFIRMLGYETQTISYSQIERLGFKLYLTPENTSLNEVILSASKWEETKKSVPNSIITFKPKDIVLANPQTTADLLTNTGKVFVQKSQLGGGSPMIRGFATNRVLINVDGIRMNNAIFRSGNLQNVISIDANAIQNTEVILGPGTVIYGSDAIGGVMNFYTLEPEFTTDKSQYYFGNIMSRWSSANNEKTLHFDLNIASKKWAFVTSATFSDFEDLRMGNHGPDAYTRPDYIQTQNGTDEIIINDNREMQVASGYNQINFIQKVAYKPNEFLDFVYAYHYSTTSDINRYDQLLRRRNGNLRFAEWYYGPQDWSMHHLKINYKKSHKWFDKAQFNAGFQQFEESRHNRNFNGLTRTSNVENVDAYSVNFDFLKKIGSKNRISYGLEYILNHVNSIGFQKNIETNEQLNSPSRYPDGSKWQSLAAYLQYENKLSDKFTFQSGVRFNQIWLDATFDKTFVAYPFDKTNINTSAFTGSLGFTYLASKNTALFFNAGTAFRSPNIDDVGKIYESTPGNLVVPNPNLEYEYAYNTEIGIQQKIGQAISFDITGFYTYVTDALVRRNFTLNGESTLEFQGEVSNVQAIQNAAKANVYGIQAGLNIVLFPTINWKTNANFTKGEEELDNGQSAPLRHAAPFFADTRLSFKSNKWTTDLFLVYNSKIKADDLAPSEVEKDYLYATDANGNPYVPSWYTVNLKSVFKLNETWSFSGGIENITDQRYRPYSSGITAPGRNFILAVRTAF
jgi:hemoglobin/transferrin/lactoferrin receptor protein